MRKQMGSKSPKHSNIFFVPSVSYEELEKEKTRLHLICSQYYNAIFVIIDMPEIKSSPRVKMAILS